jgi:transposase
MRAEKRRQSTEAFKREAIRLVTEQGAGGSETARNLGINAHLLGRWKRAFETKGRAAVSGNGRRASEQEELPRLRDENTRLRLARDMLKKALGFVASGSNCGMPLWPSTSTPGRLLSWVRCLRSAVVGLMRICHDTHARQSMRRQSSCEPVSRRSRPTPVTGMALAVGPHTSRTRGALWDERRHDG